MSIVLPPDLALPDDDDPAAHDGRSIDWPETVGNDNTFTCEEYRLVRGNKIDRVAVLRDLQAIEDDDYDGFVFLVQAARK